MPVSYPVRKGGFLIFAGRRWKFSILVLLSTGPLPYLDSAAKGMLKEARKEFMRLGLDRRSVVPDGSDTLIFPWRGSVALHTLTLLLAEHDFKASVEGPLCGGRRCRSLNDADDSP